MAERIVVSFYGSTGDVDALGSDHLERALSLKQSAEARGASLCAWGGEAFAFDFAPDELEEVVSLVLEQAASSVGGGGWGIGIAQGETKSIGERSGLSSLAWGAPLVCAERLARLSRKGEVLVDPGLAAVQSGELSTAGKRMGRLAEGTLVRGVRLDVATPFRKDGIAKVRRMSPHPALVGREEELEAIGSITPGSMAVVRAASGAGGTRLLEEAARRVDASRMLRIAPTFLPREPLGALRNTLSRLLAQEEAPPLSKTLLDALEQLLTGEGIDTRTAAKVVDAWLAPSEGRSGLLLVDDAGLVDADTLEALGHACALRGAFRMVVRLGEDEALPAGLASLPVGAEVKLEAFSTEAAEALAAGFFGGALSKAAARRWARRGGGMPLAIREALAEGLSTGELAWTGEEARPRDRASGRGGAAPAHSWIDRRLGYLEATERGVLVATALLGGDAPDEIVDAVSTLMEGPSARVAVTEQALMGGGWAYRPEEGWLAVTSRTVIRRLLSGLPGETRTFWHRMVGRVLEQNVGPLGLAETVYHAAIAGERASAAVLAAEAALAAAKAGLRGTAALLVDEAKSLDPDVEVPEITEEGNFVEVTPLLEGLSIQSMIEAAMGEVRLNVMEDTFSGGDDLGVMLGVPSESADVSLVGLGSEATAEGPAEEETSGEVPPARTSVAEALTALGEDPEASEDPDVMAKRLSTLVRQALMEGDVQTMEHLIVRLRVTGEHDALVDRMSAFVLLGRGDPGEALRKLREATLSMDSPGARARALLSYGIALASVGEMDRALLEALSALARAREASDRRGEQACARFLSYLSAAMGQTQAATVWNKVAQTSGEALRG